MLIDLSVRVTKFSGKEALDNEKIAAFGHLGTHFDVMNKEFPLSFVKRTAVILDVRNIKNKDIDVGDMNFSLVKRDMFVAFYSGYIDEVEYGSKEYFTSHPQLSDDLIDRLLSARVSIIGVDFAGIRRGEEHIPKDQYCADKGVFVVENLCNLKVILENKKEQSFTINTFPINFTGLSGLPCRVIAEI